MKGFVFPGDRTITVLEKDTPMPGTGEALVRTRASAICGSDLHYFRQPSRERAEAADVYSGHEPAGVVALTGAKVSGVKAGDRVVIYHVGGCNQCADCREGKFKDCADSGDHVMQRSRDGANADFILVPEGQILPLPHDFTFEEGVVMACTFGTAWTAVKNSGAQRGEVLAVWGLGPIGLNVALIAKAMGIRILGIDVSAGRRRAATSLGCEVLDGNDPELPKALRSETAGLGPGRVIETTGVASVHQLVVSAMRRRGTLVLVGLGRESHIGPVRELILKEITVKGSWIFGIPDWQPMVDFIRSHQVDVMSTVDRVVPIERFEESVFEADAAKVAKIVFTWPDMPVRAQKPKPTTAGGSGAVRT
jgi:threonine dehydrogenase-like Zn-dependent dehydrogenase